MRSVHLEYIPIEDADQFSPACVAAYEVGFEAAKARGINIKALFICNPHNPLGMKPLASDYAESWLTLIQDSVTHGKHLRVCYAFVLRRKFI